jgi:sRNA-binding protein
MAISDPALKGAARIDLCGNEVGTVSAEEAEYALAVAARRRELDAKWQAGLAAKNKPKQKSETPKRLGFGGLKVAAIQRREARDLLVKSVRIRLKKHPYGGGQRSRRQPRIIRGDPKLDFSCDQCLDGGQLGNFPS